MCWLQDSRRFRIMTVYSLENLEHSAMKYTVSIEIALPRERVVSCWQTPAHLPKWLRGLVLHEPLSGTHGQVGTTSRVVMQMGKQKIECTETITRREPADLHGTRGESVVDFDREIVAKGMWSAARERLTEAGPETTLWSQWCCQPDRPACAADLISAPRTWP